MTFLTVAENLKIGEIASQLSFQRFHILADPEGKNVSGMTQALPELIGGFVYPYAGIIDKKWVADENGQFVPSYFADRDAMVSAMQFGRDMYEEGVIEKDIALAKLETSKEKYL